MDPILDAIDAALERKGLSDAAASKLAVGHPSLIKNFRMPREGEKRYNLPALKKLADVLDLEFYFGPPRETGPVEIVKADDTAYAHIPLHDALLSAGSGAQNADTEIIGHLAFRRDWLKKIGVAASNAALARVTGDSMQPTIFAGDLVLVDTSKREIAPRKPDLKATPKRPIYAVLEDGHARVKRIDRPSADMLLLSSDNPDYAPEILVGPAAHSVHIIGKVVWWGHTAVE